MTESHQHDKSSNDSSSIPPQPPRGGFAEPPAPSAASSSNGGDGAPGEGGSWLSDVGPASPARQRGRRIAGFELVERIDKEANNAFGEVWLARRLDPFQRVAIKFLRPDRVREDLVRRFRGEAKALARLNHPYIARFFELGLDRDTPYLVMQYVPGSRITRCCDAQGLSIEKRLEMMAKVCDAVQHVHLQGLVHRDLKPDNILVSETGPGERSADDSASDSGPIPVLIDFGLAKSTNPDNPLTSNMPDGVGRGLFGTYSYASPEQIRANREEDTGREADVYALGAVLFELLAGVSPMQHVLEDESLSAQQRAMSLAHDDRPTLLWAFDRLEPERRAAIASARGTTEAGLRRALRSRLRHLTEHALRSDPRARFSDARALGRDIENYLADRDFLEAAAEPAASRLLRHVRRHLLPYAAAALVFVALAVGLGAALWQWQEAELAREAADAATQAERTRAAELAAVAEFQAEMLATIDSVEVGVALFADLRRRLAESLAKRSVPEPQLSDRVASVYAELLRINATDAAKAMLDRTILSPAVQAIESRLGHQPAVAAQLLQTLANLYFQFGLYDAALELQRSTLEIRRDALGSDHVETLRSLARLGEMLLERGDLPSAEQCIVDALDSRRRTLGELHKDTLDSLATLTYLRAVQNHDDAERYARQTLEQRRRALGERHRDTIASLAELGSILRKRGRLEDSEVHLRIALEQSEALDGPDHPNTLVYLVRLGLTLAQQHRYDKAQPLYQRAMDARRRTLGETHPNTLVAIHNMGGLLSDMGRYEEAEPYIAEALEKRRQVLGNEHRSTLSSINSMGLLLSRSDRLEEAERYHDEARKIAREALGESDPDTLLYASNLAQILRRQRRYPEAEAVLRETVERSLDLPELVHPRRTIDVLDALGEVLWDQGKFGEARTCFEAAFERSVRVLDAADPVRLRVANNLGLLFREQGLLHEAEPLLRQAYEIGRTLGSIRATLAYAQNLGGLLSAMGRHDEAEPILNEALRQSRRELGDQHPLTTDLLSSLGTLLLRQDRLDAAEPHLREVLDRDRAAAGDEAPQTIGAVLNLAVLYSRQDRLEEAIALLEPAVEPGRRAFVGDHARELARLLFVLGRARVGVGFDAERFTLAEANLLEAYPIYLADEGRGPAHKDTLECVQALVDLYTAWHGAEPGNGHDAKAAEWRARIEARPADAP